MRGLTPDYFSSERGACRLDDNTSAFFVRELTAIRSRTYDVVYPQYKALTHLPISSEAGPGADTVVFYTFDRVGTMKYIGNYADDLPRADVFGEENRAAVKSIGNAYGYNVQEIAAAALAGRPLPQRRANAARETYDQTVNKIGWLADGSATYGGNYGLLFSPNIGISQPTTGTWSTASADNIIADFAKVFAEQQVATKGVEVPNTALFPLSVWTRLTSIPRSTLSDTTVLEFLKKNYPMITTWDWVNELGSVTSTKGLKPSGTAGSTNCVVLFNKSSDKFVLELPRPFEQLPPQAKNLEWVVNCHARVAGVIMYYPLSVYVMEGV
jgi:hypothetical protein